VWPSITFVGAGIWKKSGRVACWTDLDCASLELSFSKLDFSRRNWDDFSTSGCKCLNTNHYPVWRKLH
jgi:hypothetical protein